MGTLGLLLKESWSCVEDRADDLAHHFYARMFLAERGLRELFPITMASQRTAFVRKLVEILQTVDDPDRFDVLLRNLGRDHRKFHVERDHYEIMGTALLDTLREFGADRWCPEFEQAWRSAYQLMATAMIEAADRDAHLPPFWHAEVVSHQRRGDDLAVFSCRPLSVFAYAPGQYTSLECHHHPRLWRPYSIANAPRSDHTLEFHVRAAGATGVSSALVRQLRVGDIVRLSQPLGSMTLARESTRDIVCIAGGTGFAPIKAIIEQLGQENGSRWVYVFLGARTRAGLYDLAALNRFAAWHPWLSIVAACSEEPDYPGDRGPVNEVIERYGPWSDHEFYVCGPAAMLRATLGSLSRLHIPDDNIHYDA